MKKIFILLVLILQIRTALGNDSCANAIQIIPTSMGASVTAQFGNSGITSNTCNSTASQDLWYYFIAPGSTVQVDLIALNNGDAAVQIISDSCTGLSMYCMNVPGANSIESVSLNNLTPGKTYYIRVMNMKPANPLDSFMLNLTTCHPPSIFSSATKICDGDTLILSASLGNGYQWYLNGFPMGNQSSMSFIANSSGTATCQIIDYCGLADTTISYSFIVTPVVQPLFNAIDPVCIGSNFGLPSVSNNNVSGTWTPPINNQASTVYTFTPNPGQCAIDTSLLVQVNVLTTPTFALPNSICINDNLTFSNVSSNNVTGSWLPASNNQATTTYTFTPASTQCAMSITTTVVVNPLPTPIITNNNGVLEATFGYANYKWFHNGLLVANSFMNTYTPSQNGLYEVYVTDINGCQAGTSYIMNNVGILDIASRLIHPNPVMDKIYVPSAAIHYNRTIPIYDITGRKIMEAMIQGGAIDVSILNSGNYFLLLEGSLYRFHKL